MTKGLGVCAEALFACKMIDFNGLSRVEGGDWYMGVRDKGLKAGLARVRAR